EARNRGNCQPAAGADGQQRCGPPQLFGSFERLVGPVAAFVAVNPALGNKPARFAGGSVCRTVTECAGRGADAYKRSSVASAMLDPPLAVVAEQPVQIEIVEPADLRIVQQCRRRAPDIRRGLMKLLLQPLANRIQRRPPLVRL